MLDWACRLFFDKGGTRSSRLIIIINMRNKELNLYPLKHKYSVFVNLIRFKQNSYK